MSIKNKVFDPLGDGISKLELIDYMGSDASVVRAARCSYAKDHKEFDPEKDAKLIRYMLAHHHSTPFEHTSVTFMAKMPIFVARQWIRHRIGVSYNEVSRRYTADEIEFFYPREWRAQDNVNRQGSAGLIEAEENGKDFIRRLERLCLEATTFYHAMTANNVAKEMARMCLPVNLYTRWYFTANLQSMFHFYRLRADSHAQLEIRVYAEAMGKIMNELYPISWGTFLELERGNGEAKS